MRTTHHDFTKAMDVALRAKCIPLAMPSGGLHRARKILSASGLPKPWPALAERFCSISDELGCRVQCDRVTEVERQWNPYSGVWLLADRIHRSPATIASNRLVPTLMHNAGRVLYGVVHETAHMMVTELALRGLLKVAPDPVAVNLVGELFAEYASYYELGVQAHPYWRQHWSPLAESSEAQHCNAGIAALRVGARSRLARAELALSAYYDGYVPTTTNIGDSAELASVWAAQRAYAAKSWQVCRQWQTLYWRDEAMQAFVDAFVPDQPAPLWLTDRVAPIEVASATDLVEAMPMMVGRWCTAPASQRGLWAARRSVQRAALGICQLRRVVTAPEARLTSTVRNQAQENLTRAYDLLRAQFHALAQLHRGVSAQQAANTQRDVSALLTAVVERLSILCGPYILIEHPAVAGREMSEQPLHLHGLRELVWPDDPSAQATLLDNVRGSLHGVIDALASLATHTCDAIDDTLLATLQRLAWSVDRLRPDSSASCVHPVMDAVRRMGDRLSEGPDTLTMPYRWQWAKTRPFVDPRIGFLVR